MHRTAIGSPHSIFVCAWSSRPLCEASPGGVTNPCRSPGTPMPRVALHSLPRPGLPFKIFTFIADCSHARALRAAETALTPMSHRATHSAHARQTRKLAEKKKTLSVRSRGSTVRQRASRYASALQTCNCRAGQAPASSCGCYGGAAAETCPERIGSEIQIQKHASELRTDKTPGTYLILSIYG